MAAPANDVQNIPELQYLTTEEVLDVFDSRARRRLNMSGAEFLRRWRDGQYDDSDDPDVVSVTMLLPLIGEDADQRRHEHPVQTNERATEVASRKDEHMSDDLELFSEERGIEIFDARARHLFGVSGPEFVERWKAGCYDHLWEEHDFMLMLFSLPLVGENPWPNQVLD